MKGSTIYENEKVLFGICVAEVLLGGGTFCFFLICPQWILVIFAVFLACTLGNFILGFRLGMRIAIEALDEDDGNLTMTQEEGGIYHGKETGQRRR